MQRARCVRYYMTKQFIVSSLSPCKSVLSLHIRECLSFQSISFYWSTQSFAFIALDSF